ncbi:MAG: putative transport system ATP-binding protein [Pseudonocardiales bacterium]|nr:putative transport system ATP-binding protein [Pseudonocardiales bacterium]MDT4921761.1 putative transport system ATP-binding protein [Pseudonocardiales bacterium]
MTTPAADRALVRCTDVGRTYGSGQSAVVAVYDVTCEVWPGDHIAIVGPSGSGKSTLLHLLAGLEVPTVGSLEWPGFGGQPRGPGSVGLVFQTPSLIPSMTVVENVELPLLFADADPEEARTRADEALALLDLRDLRDDLPQELSGGQAQRAVIARVLASGPRLILADEPTSKLDRANGAHVADVLVDVSVELGAALVIATHDPLVSGRLSDEWPMRDGRLSHLDVYDLPFPNPIERQ